MITCYLRYIIDPYKVKEFEHYAKLWIPLVNQYGGTHLGYFLPHEGASDVAVALFNFPSLAAYEVYRTQSAKDPQCIAAYEYAVDTRCIISYERSFMRPVSVGTNVVTTTTTTRDSSLPVGSAFDTKGDKPVNPRGRFNSSFRGNRNRPSGD